MTVKELIERLQQHDPNALVCVHEIVDHVINRDGEWEVSPACIWDPVSIVQAGDYCEGKLFTDRDELEKFPGDPSDPPIKAVFLMQRARPF